MSETDLSNRSETRRLHRDEILQACLEGRNVCFTVRDKTSGKSFEILAKAIVGGALRGVKTSGCFMIQEVRDLSTNTIIKSGELPLSLWTAIQEYIDPVAGLYGFRVYFFASGERGQGKDSTIFGWDFKSDGTWIETVCVGGKNGAVYIDLKPGDDRQAKVEVARKVLSADPAKDGWFGKRKLGPEEVKSLVNLGAFWIWTEQFVWGDAGGPP